MAIALSGGADSMALTLLAHAWAHAHGGRITALTIDHGLRAESAAEAAQVAVWMCERGITHHILTPAHAAHSNNLQENARQRRYDALAEFCRAHDILHCLVAHHAGDNRETIALHMARGDTADGASGMAAVRNYRGVRFLRPLLHAERHEIEDYLREQSIAWVDDPSNNNSDFARVRVRKQLATDAAHAANLSTIAAREGEARARRDDALSEAAMRLVTLYPTGYAELSLTAWKSLEPVLASQLLADLLTTISGKTERPRGYETARLANALDAGMGKRTLHQCEISLRGDTLRIAREFARVAVPLELSGSGQATWDNRFHVRYDLPSGVCYTLRALGKLRGQPLPAATPSLWHLDELVHLPHITDAGAWPSVDNVSIGFAPAKPLAAAPFWWLKE